MKKAIDIVEKIQCLFSMVLFIVFLCCIVLQILTRYVPFIKVMWTEELGTYSFIWATLMGAAVVLKRNEHFSFEFFRGKLKGRMKLIVETFISACIFGFSIYLTVCGYSLVKTFWNWTLTSMPGVSQRYTWSALLVSGATMAFYTLGNWIIMISEYKKGENS